MPTNDTTVLRLPRAPISGAPGSSRELIRAFASRELVFAVVGYAGAGTSTVGRKLKDLLENTALKGGPFDVTILKARDAIVSWAQANGHALPDGATDALATTIQLQDLGDKMRRQDFSAVAVGMVERIRALRAQKQGSDAALDGPVEPDGTRRAYILDSIRHPAEVHLLRSIYQHSFTLIGVVCEEDVRLLRLMKKFRDAGEKRAKEFMERDARGLPGEKHGQKVDDAFHLSDLFLDNTHPELLDDAPNPLWGIPDQLDRAIKIITHQDIIRPTPSESAMYAAHGARLRSSCLSRQVGAALMGDRGTIIGTGANEVPCAGGGVRYQREPNDDVEATDGRCAHRAGRRYCANTETQNEIIDSIIASLPQLRDSAPRQELFEALRKSPVGSLIEFSRAVHAEMDVILSASRTGASLLGSRLFVTTFPCHYCARHIVAAGVDEVQFIEPYFKSRALPLHKDSITMEIEKWTPPSRGGTQVLFHPFTGVAPRMYERAFLKDRPLKNDTTGALEVGEPGWGSAWDTIRVSYPQLEAALSKRIT